MAWDSLVRLELLASGPLGDFFLLPQHWDYKHVPPFLAFNTDFRNPTRPLSLHSEHFTVFLASSPPSLPPEAVSHHSHSRPDTCLQRFACVCILSAWVTGVCILGLFQVIEKGFVL